jgi:succinate dehydrogenase / fumarate reductase cytochrome b subunit
MELTASPFLKIILCGLASAFIHHFLAGIRHLVSDLHIGITKEQGTSWALGVMGISLLVSFLVWLKIFGVL